jgi:5-methylthioribose kinase
MVVEAIRYERGSLQLLEQRKLPLETAWVDVANAHEGWQAIRDMTVRGAPAIGISAALSLAVELSRGGAGSQFETPDAAVAFVNNRLDHLATSRPTAVNLFEAVRRLKKVAQEACAASGATGATVCEAVVAAAEAMLKEDIQANRQMGKYGADALVSAAQARGRARDGRVRVLTHCNTGSLATAAYGTALGVVRALHESGRLEHAFCTETRPYNQGARLTAYELVEDGLPATLVCDSAAAALMASGRVDAVVVGADRIAANGDTANKIGTFSLAVAAAYHDIPFFTAAPTTTIDPDLSTGELIPIEERSPEEITHFRGQRVSADIRVWNPSFDVTPAALLEGIITERGLVSRASAKGPFQVRDWLQQHGLLAKYTNGIAAASNGEQAALLPTVAGFKQLTVDSVKDYVATRPHLCKLVGPAATATEWEVGEVGDGNLNFVFILRGPCGSLCIKQAPPYVRCVGEDWPLTQDRVRIEAVALLQEARYCPEHVPAVYQVDGPMCLIAMQYIPTPHVILRKGLVEGQVYPLLAKHVASFLSRTLFHTSLLAMSSDAFRTQARHFANTEMCRLTEQVIFTDPYFEARFNRHTSPQLDADAAALRVDVEAKAAAARLKACFVQKQQALLHGDLHTGSIMVTQDTTYVIDPEFAFVGPMAFDIGKVIANFLLAFFAAKGHATCEAPRSDQKVWLLETAVGVWKQFVTEFTELWESHGHTGDAYPAELFGDAAGKGAEARRRSQQTFFEELWDESVGFAGAVMIRRLVGIAHVIDFDAIADADARAALERRALRFGRRLLVGGGREFADVAAVVSEARVADGEA